MCQELVFRRILITKERAYRISESEELVRKRSILNLEWEDNGTQGNAKEADLVNLICYLETQNAFVIFEGLAARKLNKATAKLPDVYKGKRCIPGLSRNNEKKHRPAQMLYPRQNYLNLNKRPP